MYSVVLMAALSTSGEVPDFGRHGCRGCWGGCYGCYGCYGGWGSCYGCYGCYGCSGCWGGYGGRAHGGWGRGYGYAYAPAVYSTPALMTASISRTKRSTLQAPPPDAATVLVTLPAEAKLFVDDQPTTSTTVRRVLQSPRLKPGNSYSYLLRAEIQREGTKYEQVKKVNVRAGQKAAVTFSEEGILQTARAGR
jgi:uncharacterized protein (TIGR03000 family)